ncbi:MAG TPA: HIT domain-containing protein [Anaerolineae bacterium]|nr:HIT domain-containing protein [Anaerolineae bacterium]
MKRIWSPWRMEYVEKHGEQEGCFFCENLALPDGPENLILHRGEHAFVILNRYPYTNGHMMVVPYAHQPSLEMLDGPVLAELMQLLVEALSVLRQAYGAASFNVGANIGKAAGAGVVDHVHLHVLPRWPGDTNFMATTAEVRVIPEDLKDTFERLRALWTERRQ